MLKKYIFIGAILFYLLIRVIVIVINDRQRPSTCPYKDNSIVVVDNVEYYVVEVYRHHWKARKELIGVSGCK
jgi:hypothetical protein